MRSYVSLAAIGGLSLALSAAGGALAQMPDNQSFDAQMQSQIGAAQAQNNAGMQQMWQQYLQQNGPALHQQYDQLVAQGQNVGSFEQYAYFMMMSANGTNVQGMRDAQQRQYQGYVDSNRTVQQGNEEYNNGLQNTGERNAQVPEDYDQQVLRDATAIPGENGGPPTYVPNSPPGQPVQGSNGGTYMRGQNGALYQQQGGGWAPVPQ